MEVASSQASQRLKHQDLRRSALKIASRLSLTRIELQVFSSFIECLTWDGPYVVDPRQAITRTRAQFMKDLETRHTSKVSEAFTRLEELKLLTSVRQGNVKFRYLTEDFISFCAEVTGHSPVTCNSNRSLTSDLSSHPPVTCQVTQTRPRSLDRRLNGRINGNLNGMDGDRQPATTMVNIVSLSKRLESNFTGFKTFLENNAWVEKKVKDHGIEEFSKFIEFLEKGDLNRRAELNPEHLNFLWLRYQSPRDGREEPKEPCSGPDSDWLRELESLNF